MCDMIGLMYTCNVTHFKACAMPQLHLACDCVSIRYLLQCVVE